TIRGDSLASISADDGGYDGYGDGYLPDILDLRAVHLPFDREHHNLDADRAAEMIRTEKPRLVILGASFILFPYEMGPIKDACEDSGSVLAYDASHVLGLVAGGEFQRPIKEGAEVLYGSTHKTFFGPQGGLIVTDRLDIMESVEKNLTWRFVDNAHWNRIAALGQALLEMKEFGSSYAKQVVANAKALGKALSEKGFPIMFEELGFTESHQLLIDREEVNRKYGCSINDLSVILEKSNIIIDSVGRLGIAEATRLGGVEKEMTEIADMFISAIEGKDMAEKVQEFRSAKKMKFVFD
ncbi:MAG TPA: serine hydroxymethyltransferase, partial [Euryarchaeota archaeon]|nr:serine hydroxymethyltransferase [Euryarchaeota archaeon]